MSRTHIALSIRRELPFLLLLSAVIATLLSLSGENERVMFTLLVSSCIALLMWGSAWLLCSALKVERLAFWQLLLCMPPALLLGMSLVAGLWPGEMLQRMSGTGGLALQLRQFGMMALVTMSAAGLFYFRYQHQHNLALLAEAAGRQADLQQAEAAARLALLQAQIEPHFLFNTLATVRSLIGQDAALAQRTLDLLNDYLRASLGRARRSTVTLADELALVTPLLDIACLRMGQRLHYQLAIPPQLLGTPLPPLLLQPLVENALQHGLEPSVAGGTLNVSASASGKTLLLRVADTGLGLRAQSGDGVALANVRQRLATLYGDAARLSLYANNPHGVIAEITLPLPAEAT